VLPAERIIDAIAIGASAGAVEALSLLLPAFTSSCRAAVLVVVHIPRERPSLLTDVFASKCVLPMGEVVDKTPVRPGTVYFAPPDYHLLVEPGPQLVLSVDEPVKYSRPSIDVLFESAADVYHEHLVGVILTGANEDGASGLKAVRQAGGLTIVQDPARAQVSFMPAMALAMEPSSRVLSLEQIASLFRAISLGGEA
jgi:two-component system, chemotaxis family, protein-glutamate methylesterase/glutaminase